MSKLVKMGKRLWARVTGTIDEMMNHDASTPEGAAAYYNAAIEAKEEQYKQSIATLSQMMGKADSYEQQRRDLQKAKMQYELNLRKCIELGDDDAAKVYIRKQEEIDDQVQVLKQNIPVLQANAKLQQEVVDNLKDEIEALKAEKDKTILTLETSQSIKSLKVDSHAAVTEEEKMLEKVRDGVQKSKEEAAGHQIAYENSTSVQQKRLDQRMRDADVEAKLQELKKAAKN